MKKTTITFRIDKTYRSILKKAAKKEKLTLSSYVAKLLVKELACQTL